MIQAPLAKLPLVQKPPIQAPPVQTFPVLARLASTFSVQIKAILEIATPKKVVISEEVPSNTRVFNYHFVNKIEDLCINKTPKKSRPVVKTYNDNKNHMLMRLPTMQRTYIQSTLNLNQNFYILPLFEQKILLLSTLFNSIIKFDTYHRYYR